MNILVTGDQGFIAKNLLVHLNRIEDVQASGLNRSSAKEEWVNQLALADIVFHLAGSNRPPDIEYFQKDNIDLTRFMVDELEKRGRPYKFIFSSSTQAMLDNPYGKSKKDAEEYVKENVRRGEGVIYRLPGVFGKWGRPNYNSVVATFCHNIANHLPIEVKYPDVELKLIYIDDVIRSFSEDIRQKAEPGSIVYKKVEPEFVVSLGRLAEIIMSFQTNRSSLFLPDVGNGLEKALYSTWLTYLSLEEFAYEPELKKDSRGSLFELLKTRSAGQVFVSTTLPGVTRGNHFHHTKTEKFIVIQGKGLIQFRSMLDGKKIDYEVNGARPVVVDIPPGYTHNISNTGDEVMITLFWANEVFDPQNTDTYFEKV